jgi:hypothetical protein
VWRSDRFARRRGKSVCDRHDDAASRSECLWTKINRVEKLISRARSIRSDTSRGQAKIFRFSRNKTAVFVAIPHPRRGVRVVTNVGRGRRWTLLAGFARHEADGKVVWSQSTDAGVKPTNHDSATVANKPGTPVGTPGEHEAAAKTIAQGKPGRSG